MYLYTYIYYKFYLNPKLYKGYKGFHQWLRRKESACNIGGLGLIPGLGRPPGGGHYNPLQYSGLENPMDSGAWWASVYGIAQSQT